MEEEIISKGKCLYCEQLVPQKGMTKHLATHFKALEKQASGTDSSLHLVVSAGDYFLHLLMPETASLKTLDSYLRKIWLECCGHLSAFSLGNWGENIGMARKAGDVFAATKKLVYRYDFGTTTELDVAVKSVYAIPLKSIELISRNEPLPIMCSICQKEPATEICSVHVYDGGFYCETCSHKHEEECEDFTDYARMPLVNSPRTGECAYEGGTIDTERDGVYKKKQ